MTDQPTTGQPPATSEAPQPSLLDRSDVRVKHAEGFGGAVSAFLTQVKSGDLGSLPVVVGLVLIWGAFTVLNPVFLSSNNLVNLLFDCSTVGVISLGIVCVLMVGQIDLSVGSMSGFASAMVGVLWVNQGWPVLLAIVAGDRGRCGHRRAVCTAAQPARHAQLRDDLGGPARHSRHAVVFAGHQRLDQPALRLDDGQLRPGDGDAPGGFRTLLALVPGVVIFFTGRSTRAKRIASNLSAPSMSGLVLKCVIITIALEAVVFYLNTGRGVPWMFGLFLGLTVAMDYALTRTKWGRSMFAVGGNQEAARRAGINVSRIFTSAFMLCAGLAALGGVLTASRLASASQQAGTGDVNLNAIAAAVIGGTSLFGGRGNAYSAVLGIIVIQSIASGLTLLNLSSSLRFMITGAVLAIAVIVDSLARQSRMSHGRS